MKSAPIRKSIGSFLFFIGLFLARPASAQTGDTIPSVGTFYLQSAGSVSVPYPYDPYYGNEPIEVLNASNRVYLIQDSTDDFAALQGFHSLARRSMAMDDLGGDSGDGSGSESFSYVVPTNGLWLELTNVSGGMAHLNLHNATNSVYEIFSKTALTLTNWNIELALWPTNGAVMPFTVPVLDRTDNLFIWARDWTGVTSGGNTTPEWWFFKYFGTVALSDTNLDSTGEDTLLDDFLYGQDPNVISFMITTASSHISSPFPSLALDVTAGVPSAMAVMVNSTNLAAAVWQPYATNIVATLLAGDGDYLVWVGLRGLPAEATPTWQSVRLSLKTVAPALTVTSPVGGVVSVPLVQLQGFSDELLASLTYDVSNAVGVLTNQPGFLTGVFSDTNRFAFTTNYFQCYDVSLTNGLNTVTLHATDLAGNTTTTNVCFTLDYSGDTNPPVLAVIFPQAGAVLSGSNFTLQAQVADATATVTATVNGATNAVQGVVERNGTVWVAGLPLAAGTNAVTVTATDAAGNSSVTNFNVVGHDVGLTINPLTSGQLNQASVSVGGTVADTNVTITVNGVTATVNPDGSWNADDVPVNPADNAVLDVQVGDASHQPMAVRTLVQPQPSLIQVANYNYQNFSATDKTAFCDGQHLGGSGSEFMSWVLGVGGYDAYSSSAVGGDSSSGGTDWSADDPPLAPWTYASVYEANYEPLDVIETSTCNGPGDEYVTYIDNELTQLQLAAGGSLASGVQRLVRVTLAVTSGGWPVPLPAITFMGQTPQPTATNAAVGEVWVSQPAGAVRAAPVSVKDYNQYEVTAQANDVTLKILDANNGNQDLTAQTNNVIVGQPMNLHCQLSDTNQTITGLQWTVPGYAISNYVVAADSSSAVVVTNFPLNRTNAVFYWVDGGKKQVQCSAMVNGKKVTAQTTFNLLRPTATVTATTSSVGIYDVFSPFWLRFFDESSFTEGITFSSTMTIPSGFSGTNEWVQIVNPYRSYRDTNGVWWVLSDNGSGSYLDTSYPYTNAIANIATDSPGSPLSSRNNEVTAADSFKMWFMFKPTGGQWVPLRIVTWNWSGVASLSGTNWTLSSRNWSTNPPSVDAGTTFPQWNNNVKNLLFHSQP